MYQLESCGNLTALHCAASEKDSAQIEQLLSRRYNVNARDVMNQTPVHYVATVNEGASQYEVAENTVDKRSGNQLEG